MTPETALSTVVWTPLLPLAVIGGIAAVFALALAFGLLRRAKGTVVRAVPVAALLLLLAGPQAVVEERRGINDVAVIVVDDSASMALGDRAKQAEDTASALAAQLRQQHIDVRLSHGGSTPPADGGGTHLIGALSQAVADVPHSRLAGAILITDGEVHDVPTPPKGLLPAGVPLHALIVGRRHESDRRLSIDAAPAYGLVGQTVVVKVEVDDPGETAGQMVPLTVTLDGGAPETLSAPLGQVVEVPVTLHHAGQTLVDLATPVRPGELTAINNRAAVAINGVRDRLKVLLISGEPHVGERAWRGLLKSDPNVDLVHFTILRPPTKDDGTPISELALIPFPTQELFQDKLKSFDLIIFDRYNPSTIVPVNFFANVANYVREGGAVLVAAGPEFAAVDSLADSPLGDILPGVPSGPEDDAAFRPAVSDVGARHPVTAGLLGPTPWGRWLRHMPATLRHGDPLLTTPDGAPLLALDHVDQGRVALLLSDTLWLWAKDWDGGGPHAELVRRLIHWLMKEPELDEDALTLQAAPRDAGHLVIQRRTLSDVSATGIAATVTTPDGSRQAITLHPAAPGRAEATITAAAPGVWRVEADGKIAVAAVQSADPLEDRDLVATDGRLAPMTAAAGGGTYWLEDGVPRVQTVSPGDRAAGSGWLGLVANGDHAVTGVRTVPLIPAWAALALVLGGLMMAWWREGR